MTTGFTPFYAPCYYVTPAPCYARSMLLYLFVTLPYCRFRPPCLYFYLNLVNDIDYFKFKKNLEYFIINFVSLDRNAPYVTEILSLRIKIMICYSVYRNIGHTNRQDKI